MKLQAEQFHQTAPHKLEIKKGGGCIGCFGIPFFFAGIFILFVGAQIIPVSNAAEIPWWAWVLLVGMGLIFTAVGAAIVFGRRWITLDNTSGRIWIAWGLLMPMRGQAYFLKDYERVVINYDAGDSKTDVSYTIVLKSLTGSELDMLNSQNFGIIHNQALILMNFLNLPLEDNSSDNSITIKPGAAATIGITIREIEDAAPPKTLKCDIQMSENELILSIPSAKFSPLNLLGLFFPLIFALFFMGNVLSFFSHTQTPLAVQLVFIGFVGLFFILIPALTILKRFVSSHGFSMVITVNNAGIELQSNRQSRTISRENIINLDYGTTDSAISGIKTNRMGQSNSYYTNSYIPAWMARLQRFVRSKGIIVKSREGIFYIGAGLPDDELVYLYSLISSYLTKE
ncbi:MAG: hypothetical protein PHY48_09840 [Candidatus Cloacimonetes bacterium]|nr:hypothetical protein [Candidatus Cloacimonadota bacterium]